MCLYIFIPVKVWSLTTGDRLLTSKSNTDGVTCLQFSDEVIVSGSYDNQFIELVKSCFSVVF